MFEMMELGIEMQKAVREVQLKQLDAAGEALDAMQRGAALRADAASGGGRAGGYPDPAEYHAD